MSRFVSLTTMQNRVINLCDLPTTLDSTTPVTSAAMLDLLQTSCTLLAGILATSNLANFHFAESDELSTVADTSSMSLPTEASDVLRVSWLKDSETEILLNPATIDQMQSRPTGWNSQRPTYRIVGQTLEFFPTPEAAYTVKVYYSTGIYPTSLATNVWCQDGWDQWIVLQTCALVRARQQKACPEFEGPLGQLTGAILAKLNRDRSGIHVARDMRNGTQDYWITDPRKWGQ